MSHYIPPGVSSPPEADPARPMVRAPEVDAPPPHPDIDDDELEDLLDSALALAATGLPVFPCGANKRPAIPKAKGGNGFQDASADPHRIRELWEIAGPAAQLIGVPTGAASGFDVLDNDPRHGSDDWRTANIHRLPETRIHATMSGGEHWLFRHVDGVRNGASKIAPGVDVRGAGGYVCFPPSPGYRVIHEADIADWPDWLLPLVIKVAEPEPRPEPSSYATPATVTDARLRGFIDSEVRRVRDSPVGGRHNARFNAARSIGGVAAEAGLSDTEAEEMLIAARPPEVEEMKERRTIRDGLACGRATPIDLNTLPDSALFRGYRQHRRNGAAPPQSGDGPAPEPDDPGPDDPDIPAPRPDEPAELPVILCVPGQLDRMDREAQAALLTAGVEVYQRHALVHPIEEEYDAADGRKTHSAALIAFTAPAMLKLLSTVAIWQKFNERKRSWVPCDPPDKLVAIVLASRGDWTFPVIRGVLTCPTLRPDGSLLSTPGYDLRSRYYLAFPTNLVLPPIPDLPTRTDALESLTRLKALLAGFPFVDDVSRAVALCILMTQVLRCAMQVSPLLGVSANASGTGKSFLIDLANTIALGRPCPVITPGKNDEETEKGIRTKLLSSTPAFSIDNVHSNLNLALLNVATERPFISIRLFGVLEEIEVENSVTIYMTGNNLVIVDEQGRRTIRCCMDAGVERPEYRPFKNNPIEMVLKDRGRYIADILTIARAYITNGTKPDIVPMGDSHAAWSRLVREPLVWLGCEDPIKSQEISRENDPDSIKLGAIIGAWHHSFGLGARTLAHAIKPPVHPGHVPGETPDEKQWRQAAYEVELASHTDLLVVLREAFPSHDSGSVNTVQWGNWMRRYADGRVLNGLRFGKLKDRNGKDVLDHGAVQWGLAEP